MTAVNDAPVIAFTSGDTTANEGQTKTYAFSITDPDSSSFTYDAGYPNCGTGGTLVGTPTIGSSSGSFDCTFPDGPASSTVAVRIRDASVASNEITRGVTIANLPPVVVLSGPNSANEGETKTYTYRVSDPGQDPSPHRHRGVRAQRHQQADAGRQQLPVHVPGRAGQLDRQGDRRRRGRRQQHRLEPVTSPSPT